MRFQFQTGTIQSRQKDWGVSMLEAFQFQTGTIQRADATEIAENARLISIPN